MMNEVDRMRHYYIPKTGLCISERAICDFERGR